MLLGLTDNCNLACSYCFVKQKPLEMTYEIAEKSVEWLLSNHSNDSTPLVTFFGGEPLLKYDDIIVPIVEKYKEKITFSITTNGTLLDEDKVDFFFKNNVGILLSFDGVKEVQNTQRVGKEINSFDTVRDNIPYLLLRFPNTTMRMTLTKLAIPHLYDTILLAEEFGFKNITFCPNAYEDWDWDDAVTYEDQLEKIGLHIFKSFYNNNDIAIRVNPLIDYFNNIELGVLSYVRMMSKYYYGKGLNTPELIGRIYCPVFENGTKVASSHWLNLVSTAKNKYNKYDFNITINDIINKEELA